MKIQFLGKFSKDIDRINQPKDKAAILALIELVKTSAKIEDIPKCKKLVGFEDAFRIRIGDYRIGLFIDRGVATFVRVAHRKDIYRLFP